MTYGLGRGVEPYDARRFGRSSAARGRRLSILVARSRHCGKRSISDEDVAMMVTKNAASADVSAWRGHGPGAAAARRDGAGLSARAQTIATSVRRLGYVYIPMGMNRRD